MSTCDCFRGSSASDQYTPGGSYSEIAGLGVYHSKPRTPNGGSKQGSILFLPDGFGLAAHNLRVADMYAENGFETTIVDYFEGDALPDCFMKYVPGTDLESYKSITAKEKEVIRNINMPAWQKRHQPEHISELLDRFFPEFCRYLRTSETTTSFEKEKFHIVGHCFGGKHAFRFAKLGDESGVSSALIFHPSFLEASDIENLGKPVFVGCAETDVFTPSLINDMLAQLPNSGTRYKFSVYGGTKHGFASRPDPDDLEGMKVFQQAFEDGLTWLKLT
ncbi:Fc.00g104330.m01.CDS01 [Cosmosporella sp. VM-42]